MKILSNKKWNQFVFTLDSYRSMIADFRNRYYNSEAAHATFLKSIRVEIEKYKQLYNNSIIDCDRLKSQLSEANKCLEVYRNPVVQTNPVINQDLQNWLLSQKFNSTSSDQPERFFEFPFNV